jgi:hypothetical protein
MKLLETSMIRTWEPLSERTEQILSEIVDGGICVHKQVGSGFFEVFPLRLRSPSLCAIEVSLLGCNG